MLREQQRFLLLPGLELVGIIWSHRPVGYIRMARRGLVRNNFQICLPHLLRCANSDTVQCSIADYKVPGDLQQRSWIGTMPEDRCSSVVRARHVRSRLDRRPVKMTARR